MEITSLRSNLSTIADVIFCGTATAVGSFFSPRLVPFLTIHDTLLTARGRRGFTVLVFFFSFFFFFLRWSRMLLTQSDFLRSVPSVNVARHSKQARVNGRGNEESL